MRVGVLKAIGLLTLILMSPLGEISFDEFWTLKEKVGQGQRLRDVTIKVIKAENILNAGATSHCNHSPGTASKLADDDELQNHYIYVQLRTNIHIIHIYIHTHTHIIYIHIYIYICTY